MKNMRRRYTYIYMKNEEFKGKKREKNSINKEEE